MNPSIFHRVGRGHMAFRHWFLGLLAAVSTGAALPVVAEGIASAAPLAKGTDPGEVLMGERDQLSTQKIIRLLRANALNRPSHRIA